MIFTPNVNGRTDSIFSPIRLGNSKEMMVTSSLRGNESKSNITKKLEISMSKSTFPESRLMSPEYDISDVVLKAMQRVK